MKIFSGAKIFSGRGSGKFWRTEKRQKGVSTRQAFVSQAIQQHQKETAESSTDVIGQVLLPGRQYESSFDCLP